jgi:hypothetical protein
MGTLPIGYDVTTSYLSVLARPEGPTTLEMLRNFNLLYVLLKGIQNLTHLDSLLLLKIAGVVIPTWFSACFAFFAYRVLRPSWWVLALGIVFFTLQPATLRFDWDLYRNTLGLSFALLSGAFFIGFYHKRGLGSLLCGIIALVIAIFSHQMVAYALAVAVSVSIIYILAKPYLTSRWFWLLFCIVVCILYVVISPSIHAASFSLRTSEVASRTLVRSLFWLLYASVLPLALLGLKRYRHPLLFIGCGILFIHSFSPFLFPGHPFFLWDRWMYFLTIPLGLLGLAGLMELSALAGLSQASRYALTVVCAAFSVLPGIRLLMPSYKIPTGTVNPPQELFSYMPPTFLWNSIGYEQVGDLRQAADVARRYTDESTPIFTSDPYSGLIWYVMPDLAPHITVVPPADPPWSPQEDRYLIYGINYARLAEGSTLPESNPHQPVRLFDASHP